MGSLFNAEGKVMSGFTRAVELVILCIIWMACNIPIFTFGASTTAFYYAYHKSIRQKRGYPWKEFFGAFKANFKQSTLIWLIVLALYILTTIDCLILYAFRETVKLAVPLLFVIIIIMVCITLWMLYLFPYTARFENSIKATLKNCALIAIANLPWSILLLVLLAIALVIFILIPPVVGFFVPACYICLANVILERIFRKYMSEEDVKAQEEMDKLE